MQKVLRHTDGVIQKWWKFLSLFDVFETVNSKNVVFTVISERHADTIIIWAYIYCGFWDREIIFVKKAVYVEQKSRLSSQAANLGYEIPALLYSLLKPTRTLIAKASWGIIQVDGQFSSRIKCQCNLTASWRKGLFDGSEHKGIRNIMRFNEKSV